MCGIAGFCGHTKNNKEQIKKMCDKMIFRGPNAEGYWLDGELEITFGHRRLSILDLSENGAQPMVSASGRFVICYNGEIYNYYTLREKLIQDKHITHFRGTSDTEVILEAFEAYGLNAVNEMKGMFAIALFDRKEKTLYLFRDRMGEKPLYYGTVGGKFAFASDLSCLKALDGFDNAVSSEALSAYVCYKSVPQPLSIYENIYKLLPGQMLTLKAPFANPTLSTFWSLKDVALNAQASPFEGSEEEAREHLRNLLKDTIKGQMISDVPIGAFLSGGIDSPLIVSIMQSISTSPVKTFTIGFEDPKYNEAAYAKDIAKHLGTDHTELYINEQDLKNVIPLLPTMFSEPLADPAGLPTYLVSKLAKEKVTVTLSGDGGDELFCGYEIYNRIDQLWEKINRIPYPLRNAGGKLLQHSPLKYNNKFYSMGEYACLKDSHHLHELFRNEHTYDARHVVAHVDSNLIYSDDLFVNLTDRRASMLYRDQSCFLTDTVLNKVDRSGMFISLENRIPLLDKDIVEFSWSLPMSYKSSAGCNKKILKELLYEYVPKSMLDRPKHGFEVPLPAWLSTGDLHDWAGDLISSSRLVSDGFFDKKVLNHVWTTFNNTRNNTLLLWYLLQAEAWYRQNN